jgi:hypothetical protein
MEKLKELENKYNKVLEKLDRLNDLAFELEKEMCYERNKNGKK